MSELYPRAGVSVAVFRGNDDVLLVQRSKGPYTGFWSLPGGSIRWGEAAADAGRRELEEETGLLASTLTLGDVADAIVRDCGGNTSMHYTIVVFAASGVSGALAASGDATDAGWFGREARKHLKRTPGLEAAIDNARRALDKDEK